MTNLSDTTADSFRLLFETMSHGVIFLDSVGRITQANPAAERIFGLTLSQMQGRTPMDPHWRTIHRDGSEYPGETQPAMLALRTGRAVREVMGVFNPAVDAYRWIDVSAVPLFQPGESTPSQVYVTLDDVTERVATTRALRDSERRFRSLFESMVEGVALHEIVRDASGAAIDYRIIDVNPAYEAHTGLRAADVRGTLATSVYGGGSPFLDVYAGVADSGQPCSFETYFKPWLKHFQVRAFSAGRDRFATVFEDITERKRSEAALRLNEARLQALHEIGRREFASEAALIQFALEQAVRLSGSGIGYFHFVSEDQEDIEFCTWSKEALNSRSAVDDRHYPVRTAGIWADCIRLLRPVVHNDYQHESGTPGYPAGHSHIVRHASACAAEDGLVRAIVGVANKESDYDDDDARQLQLFIDGVWAIISRRRSEAALRMSEARTRATYEHLPVPTLVWERHDGDFALVDSNAAARECMITSGFQSGRRTARVLYGNRRDILDDLARCLEERSEFKKEIDLAFGAAERLRRFVVTYGHVPPDRVIVHMEDVTEQRRTEEQLRMAQKMEAIGRLAGGIAHDFNNLLSVITGYADLVLDRLPAADGSRKNVEQILEAGRRAASLTSQLLAFSRKQVLQPEIVSLNHVVAGMENLLRRLLPEDIDLSVVLDADLGHVKADPDQLGQVILNLAVNAKDAMPEGGRLTLETANVELDDAYVEAHLSVRPGSYILLAVTDTGQGMDSETQAQIFEPFFTTKGPQSGTGLGLATVYGVVRQSGGDILVASRSGKGTTFRVYLPRDLTGAPPPLRIPVPQPRTTGDETILIVEDEPAVRNLVSQILGDAGYTVLTAANGDDALRVVEGKKASLDLLLSDVVMPRMSGLDLAGHVAGIAPQLKVLFMSGYTDHAILNRGNLEAGAHFIGKPFTPSQLMRKIREVLDQTPESGRPTSS